MFIFYSFQLSEIGVGKIWETTNQLNLALCSPHLTIRSILDLCVMRPACSHLCFSPYLEYLCSVHGNNGQVKNRPINRSIWKLLGSLRDLWNFSVWGWQVHSGFISQLLSYGRKYNQDSEYSHRYLENQNIVSFHSRSGKSLQFAQMIPEIWLHLLSCIINSWRKSLIAHLCQFNKVML